MIEFNKIFQKKIIITSYRDSRRITISQDFTFKISVFGDSGVGKTSMIVRYITDQFDLEIGKTMGVDIRIKKIKINEITGVLQIWDMVGEQRFRIVFPTYARGSSVGIFMYDITNKISLNSIDDWLQIYINANPQKPIMMVGGKLDLQEMRVISIEDAIRISKSHDCYDYIECSAKTGENIENLFNNLLNKIMENVSFL